MRVLFVTYDFPYPTNTGGKNRAYHLLKFTAKEEEVYLYSFVRQDFNPDYNREIMLLGVKEIRIKKRKKLNSFFNIPKTLFNNSSIFKTLYFDKEVESELIRIITEKKIDLIHFESSYTGFYIGKKLKKNKVAQVLGTENIEFTLYYDYAKSLKNPFLKPFVNYQAGRLKKEELMMVKNSDTVTTITQDEADFLKKNIGKDCVVIPNGIDEKAFPFKIDKKLKWNILFVGNFTYFPNVDAVNFFYFNVFKKLDKKIKFTIIGKKCFEKFKFDDERVIMKDFVEDIIPEYRNADILIFPISIGGGTNFKVLEAMALGVPIVAFSKRLSGLKVHLEEHFLEASTPEQYISQIKRLYSDDMLRKKLSENSRKVIEKYYGWNAIGKDLLKVWRNNL